MLEPNSPADSHEPTRKLNIARPLIGLAISICVAAFSFLTGIVTFCGTPGNGYNGGGAPLSFVTKLLIITFCLSILCIVVCVFWFLFVLIRKSTTE